MTIQYGLLSEIVWWLNSTILYEVNIYVTIRLIAKKHSVERGSDGLWRQLI